MSDGGGGMGRRRRKLWHFIEKTFTRARERENELNCWWYSSSSLSNELRKIIFLSSSRWAGRRRTNNLIIPMRWCRVRWKDGKLWRRHVSKKKNWRAKRKLYTHDGTTFDEVFCCCVFAHGRNVWHNCLRSQALKRSPSQALNGTLTLLSRHPTPRKEKTHPRNDLNPLEKWCHFTFAWAFFCFCCFFFEKRKLKTIFLACYMVKDESKSRAIGT